MTNEMRVLVVIDGANTYAACKALNMPIDYNKLKTWLNFFGHVIRIYYYTAILSVEDQEIQPIRRLYDWLDYNGFVMRTKEAKVYINKEGETITKGNMDVEIVTDIITLSATYDILIMFSGDGDFAYALRKLQDAGKRIIVISTKETNPPFVADTMRRLADEFIDLRPLIDKIGMIQKNYVPIVPNQLRTEEIENIKEEEEGLGAAFNLQRKIKND